MVRPALTAAGADLMYDCRKGECGLPGRRRRDNGRLDHSDMFLSTAQKESGRRLCLCVSRAVAEAGRDGPAVLELALP